VFSLQKKIVHLVGCAIFVASSTSARAFEDEASQYLVGKWRTPERFNVIIEKDGQVFSSDGADYMGTLAHVSGQTFELHTAQLKCEYNIAILAGFSETDWRLIEEKKGCPAGGVFRREADLNKKQPEILISSTGSPKLSPEVVAADIAGSQAPPSHELAKVKFLYFEKSVDGNKVLSVLNNLHVIPSLRPAANTQETNVITCTPDVDISALRKVATSMLDAGVPIRSIAGSHYGDKLNNLITLEGYPFPSGLPVMTHDDVTALAACPQTIDELYPYYIELTNGCEQEAQDFFVRYRSSKDGTEKATYLLAITPNEHRLVLQDNGVVALTRQNGFFYRVKRSSTTQWTIGKNTDWTKMTVACVPMQK
jgi:hypothetical protein